MVSPRLAPSRRSPPVEPGMIPRFPPVRSESGPGTVVPDPTSRSAGPRRPGRGGRRGPGRVLGPGAGERALIGFKPGAELGGNVESEILGIAPDLVLHDRAALAEF